MERYKKEFKEISTRQITMDIPNDFIYHIENVLSKMNNIDTINAFDQIVKSLNDATKKDIVKKLINAIIMQTNLKEYFM
jgi:hypothetical protein